MSSDSIFLIFAIIIPLSLNNLFFVISSMLSVLTGLILSFRGGVFVLRWRPILGFSSILLMSGRQDVALYYYPLVDIRRNAPRGWHSCSCFERDKSKRQPQLLFRKRLMWAVGTWRVIRGAALEWRILLSICSNPKTTSHLPQSIKSFRLRTPSPFTTMILYDPKHLPGLKKNLVKCLRVDRSFITVGSFWTL